MNNQLKNLLEEQLRPDGIWHLSKAMSSLLRYQMGRLPRRKVSETETRYPVSTAGKRAFLEVFFTRHFFQVQNSLLNYMASQDFLTIIESGRLSVLDIGSGPAVASPAITDMLVGILECLRVLDYRPASKTVKVNYILNDTVGICLDTGQCMLHDYFRIDRKRTEGVVRAQTISVQTNFPENMGQIRRIASNMGGYDLSVFSYVVLPLNKDNTFDNLVNELLNVKNICRSRGLLLILQDRFNAALIRRLGKAMGVTARKERLTQYIYPKINMNETYTYSYYSCLCKKSMGEIFEDKLSA